MQLNHAPSLKWILNYLYVLALTSFTFHFRIFGSINTLGPAFITLDDYEFALLFHFTCLLQYKLSYPTANAKSTRCSVMYWLISAGLLWGYVSLRPLAITSKYVADGTLAGLIPALVNVLIL